MKMLRFIGYLMLCGFVVANIFFVTCTGFVTFAQVINQALSFPLFAWAYFLSGILLWLYLSTISIKALNRRRRRHADS